MTDVISAHSTGGNNPVTMAFTGRLARHQRTAYPVGQSQRGYLPAAIPHTVGPRAYLTAFRRVDTAEPNTLPVNLDRVSVDDRRYATDFFCRCVGSED